jgi:predicted nuclease of predicted toxin-antitoxin system
MKRILLDQGLAPHAATILCEHGFDAVHVSAIGMAQAEDAEILEFARSDSRVCVTLDHDFHAHLASAGQEVLLWYCCVLRAWMRQVNRI